MSRAVCSKSEHETEAFASLERGKGAYCGTMDKSLDDVSKGRDSFVQKTPDCFGREIAIGVGLNRFLGQETERRFAKAHGLVDRDSAAPMP